MPCLQSPLGLLSPSRKNRDCHKRLALTRTAEIDTSLIFDVTSLSGDETNLTHGASVSSDHDPSNQRTALSARTILRWARTIIWASLCPVNQFRPN